MLFRLRPTRMLLLSLMVASATVFMASVDAYSTLPVLTTKRSSLYMRRGGGGRKRPLDRDVVGGSSKSGGGLNWCPIPAGQSLPQQAGKVQLLDTDLPTMKNAATNPTGAVAVVQWAGQSKSAAPEYYCFASRCPSCQIPLTQAKVRDGDDGPQLSCNFCKASYDLKSGSRLETESGGGMFGGLVKSVFASKNTGPMPIYKLGEKNGKLMIVVDQ